MTVIIISDTPFRCIQMSVLICTTNVMRLFCPSDVKLILVYIREKISFLPQCSVGTTVTERGGYIDDSRARSRFCRIVFPGERKMVGGWLEGYGCVFIHGVPCRMQFACGEYSGTRNEHEPSGCLPYGDSWYVELIGKRLPLIFHVLPLPVSITYIQSVHFFLYTNLRY